jgi:hypothetical protein
MPIGNGGIIGVANNPTNSVATGVWSLQEQFKAEKASNWPSPIPMLVEVVVDCLPLEQLEQVAQVAVEMVEQTPREALEVPIPEAAVAVQPLPILQASFLVLTVALVLSSSNTQTQLPFPILAVA